MNQSATKLESSLKHTNKVEAEQIASKITIRMKNFNHD